MIDAWIRWRYGLLPQRLRPPLGFRPVRFGGAFPTLLQRIGYRLRRLLWRIECWLYEGHDG